MKNYINKQLKIREKNLKYDFLPSMIEIIEKPTNKLGMLILFFIIAMMITTLIWAAVFKIDIAVTATGVIQPSDGIVTIAGSQDGVIEEILVQDGATVKEGDVIIRLEGEDYLLALRTYEEQAELYTLQKEVYLKVYEALKSEDKTLELDPAEYEHSQVVESVLLEHNIFLEQLKDVFGKEKELAIDQQTLKILQYINSLDVNIQNINANIEQTKLEIEDLNITANASGTVDFVNEFHVGDNLSANNTIGYITNSGEKEYIAYVADEDITSLHSGQTVMIKITAYDDTEYEVQKGTIVSIADVPVVSEKGTQYKVQMKLNQPPEDLQIGLEGNCNIILGQRTVLEYFLEPFIEGLEGSMKEK